MFAPLHTRGLHPMPEIWYVTVCFFGQVRESVEELSRAILTIEGTGDKAEAEDLLSKYAIMTPELQQAFKALENVQVTYFGSW